MKKIINGRRYDTETAKLVGYISYSTPGSLDYWCDSLYKKKTGEFFLHGEGGPMSKHSKRTGENEWSYGQEIIPLKLSQAQRWAERHLTADEYEAIFGVVEEGKVQVSTWIEESIKEEIDKLREQKDLTIADIIKAGVKHSRRG